MWFQDRNSALLPPMWFEKQLIMKQNNQSLGYFILIAGIALIITGFFLLIPAEKRTDIFWLDLIVGCVVYLASFARIYGLFIPTADFDKQIGGLGIRLAYIPLYSLSALAIIFICWHYKIEFRYQLYLQLIAGFFLVLAFFLSQIGSGKVISVQNEQDMNRKGKNEILQTITRFDILFTNNTANWATEKTRMDSFKETVRYLSPTNNQYASDIDSEIVESLQKAYNFLNENKPNSSEFFSMLNKCEELIKLRKNTYSN